MFYKLNKKSFPFLFILLVHIFLLLFTIYKRGFKNTVRLLISSIGMAYIFEYFVLNLFRSYVYSPKIFKDTHLDNVFGAILSQAVYVPISAIFITIFRLGFVWKGLFTTYLVIVERVFLHLKIHNNLWWKTFYTGFLIPVYFYIVDFWYKKLRIGSRPFTTISIYLAFVVIHINTLYFYVVKKFVRFGFKKVDLREHFIVTPLYTLILSVLYTINSFRKSFMTNFYFLILLVTIDMLLINFKVLKVKNWLWTFFPLHAFLIVFGKGINQFYQDDSRKKTI
ncbi:hypothetical protein QA612_00955 [Evansella sp. AB-P1]|uniref:hypothetical protein n=1 Tax=Evansella sp. AB-P1 TaxID=3037653 RepID=UPI00241BF4FA|nr:hypothetical protein [Evansella sp. AB-P1]MDG5786039.1 hypothetical protein [Evansella sp. AB-P1]